MIASGGVAPTDVDGGKFSCAVVLDANDAPIGAAFMINQVDSEQSVKALPGRVYKVAHRCNHSTRRSQHTRVGFA